MLDDLDLSPKLAVLFCLAWRAKGCVVTGAPEPARLLLSCRLFQTSGKRERASAAKGLRREQGDRRP